MKGIERILPMLLLFATQIQAIAQDPFNRRYDALQQNEADFGWSLEQTIPGEYVIVSNSPWTDSASYVSIVTVSRINEQGVLLQVERFVDTGYSTYPGWSNSSHRLSSGGLVIGGNRVNASESSKAALFIADENGMPVTQYNYGVPGQTWAGRQAKQAGDGGFVLVGSRSLNSNLDGFLIKTDANGEQEWVQTYGGPWIDSFIAVDTVSGGYYLGGMSTPSSGNRDQWVLRVDVGGIPIWEKKWGTAFNDSNPHITTARDGHVLSAGVWLTTSDISGRLYLAKLDSADGSIIWDRTYGAPSTNTTFFAVKEVDLSGDLIATGQASLGFNTDRGVLLRTTQSGDSLWMRYYSYYDTEVSNGQGQLRDVLPTADGGFIAVGAAFGVSNPVNPPGYGQDVWVIKTDEHGCLEPGCHLITGMETQITNLVGALRVWPNPVAAGTPTTLVLELPEHFTPKGALRLTVVSSDGRVVHEQRLPSPYGQFTLQAPASSGVYHVHLSDDTRWIAGAKLVVE
ncbi:MAG: hypothetical protein KF905_03245 [Flavobacteriales bacterium]|nr:hypothetical protein [Flavobacteriales bacterium]